MDSFNPEHPWLAARPDAFAAALPKSGPILVLCHNDADGLTSGAVLARGLARVRDLPTVRLVGRFESAWSPALAAEIRAHDPALLVVADLGVRADPLGAPAVLIDHHVPQGLPEGATVISGYGREPTPSSSLLAYQSLRGVTEIGDLLWIAALGLIGDYGEKAPFAELQDARARHKAKVLREATSLINAPRRSATGDARPAFDLLLKAEGPEDVVSGAHPETALLQAARDEVKAELDAARRLAPRFAGAVALIEMDSPCQIHPLIAQSWTGRLRQQIVIAANHGFRKGQVHFAVRSATGRNLVAFLSEHAPPGAAESGAYGQGHEQATGGALSTDDWATFLAGLGFKPR